MKHYLKKILNKFRAKEIYYIYGQPVQYQNMLKDKNVVIIGGTSGIGYAIAKKMIACRANVIITGTSKEKLLKASQELKCKTLQWDITNLSILREKIDELYSLLNGKLDCYIQCAGVYNNLHWNDCTEDEWTSMMNTNLKGPYFAINEIIKTFFEQQKKGNIILIGSNRGIFADDGPYGISKVGIIHFGKGLAKSLLKYNIRVNIINPGMTASNINGMKDTDNLYDKSLSGKRVLAAVEIAEVACFLCSDSSLCLTGQVINADNGESIL